MRRLLPLTLLLSSAALAQDRQGATEYEIKAAFLLNFARYVEWPEKAFDSADAPIVVGVVGKDPFDNALEAAFKDKQAGGRRIAIVRYATAKDARACHMLFVAASERDSLALIVEALKDAPVLLVADHDGFAARGGAVNFYTENSRVRFEINPEAADRRGLKLSSKLLKLARIVKDK